MSEFTRSTGQVTQTGPLRVLIGEHAESAIVAGWVDGRDEGSTVTLRVNGRDVLSTQCNSNTRSVEGAPPDACSFSFRCDQLAELLGAGDVITIVHQGMPLPFPGGSNELACSIDRRSRGAELFARLERGETFNKFGKLVPPTDAAHAREAVRLYRGIVQLLEHRLGLTVFPCYGTLLGIIRESGLLKQDSRGFDAVCLMETEEPADVRADFIKVCELLVNEGYYINPNADGVYIRDVETRSAFVDLHFAWFTNDRLQLSYGWYHEPARSRAEFLRKRTARLFEMELRVPGNSEAVLEQIYGEGWGFPDQGFTHDAGTRHIEHEHLLDSESLLRLYKFAVNRARVAARQTNEQITVLQKTIKMLKADSSAERRLVLRALDAVRLWRTLVRAGYHRLSRK